MATLTQSMSQMTPQLSKGFIDIDATLVFNYVLQPGQTVNALQQPISGDGDYWLCGMQATSVLLQRPDLIELAGNVGVRISDDTGYRLQSDFINIAFLTPLNGNSYPKPIRPAHLFKAGTRINIDLQELSNITAPPIQNIVQVVFRGRYRYRESDLNAQAALLKQTQMYRTGRR